MKRIEIRDLFKSYEQFEDQEITICGWARTVRDSKNIAFVELNDGAFKSVQVVVEREPPQVVPNAADSSAGSALSGYLE